MFLSMNTVAASLNQSLTGYGRQSLGPDATADTLNKAV